MPPEGQPAPQQGQPAPQDWKAGLPEELKGEKSLESFKDIGGLAKSYVEAQKMIGGSVRIPKEDAKPEEWEAFYTKLGRPAKVEDYGVAKPTDIPEGVSWNEDLTKWFLSSAHAAGLNKTQVTKILTAWNEKEFAQAHALIKEMGAQLGKLREDWGTEFEGRVELGVRGIERLLPKEEADKFKELMDSTGLGNHPLVLKYTYLVGKMLKEDGYIIGSEQGGGLSAEGLKEKIASIRADKNHPYNNPKDPGHAKAKEEMHRLYALAFPERKV